MADIPPRRGGVSFQSESGSGSPSPPPSASLSPSPPSVSGSGGGSGGDGVKSARFNRGSGGRGSPAMPRAVRPPASSSLLPPASLALLPPASTLLPPPQTAALPPQATQATQPPPPTGAARGAPVAPARRPPGVAVSAPVLSSYSSGGGAGARPPPQTAPLPPVLVPLPTVSGVGPRTKPPPVAPLPAPIDDGVGRGGSPGPGPSPGGDGRRGTAAGAGVRSSAPVTGSGSGGARNAALDRSKRKTLVRGGSLNRTVDAGGPEPIEESAQASEARRASSSTLPPPLASLPALAAPVPLSAPMRGASEGAVLELASPPRGNSHSPGNEPAEYVMLSRSRSQQRSAHISSSNVREPNLTVRHTQEANVRESSDSHGTCLSLSHLARGVLTDSNSNEIPRTRTHICTRCHTDLSTSLVSTRPPHQTSSSKAGSSPELLSAATTATVRKKKTGHVRTLSTDINFSAPKTDTTVPLQPRTHALTRTTSEAFATHPMVNAVRVCTANSIAYALASQR